MRIKELTGAPEDKLGPVPGQSVEDVELHQKEQVKAYIEQEKINKEVFDEWSND